MTLLEIVICASLAFGVVMGLIDLVTGDGCYFSEDDE